jgi:hypothetical protein
MNESEWMNCTDPKEMLKSVGTKLNEHQLKKFSLACYHQIEQFLTDEAKMVIEAVELEVNGKPDPAAFRIACSALKTEIFDSSNSSTLGGIINDYVLALTEPPALEGVQSAISAVLRVTEWETNTTEYAQARAASLANLATILREIVGNPFSH